MLTLKASEPTAVLVLPPFFYKGVSDDGVVEYYKRVVEEVGDNNLKYILYHIPQVSGVNISFDVIAWRIFCDLSSSFNNLFNPEK